METFTEDRDRLIRFHGNGQVATVANVDLVDAERIKLDPRLPFGLPGVNKEKKVSNGNYLWISYFWSYLNDRLRGQNRIPALPRLIEARAQAP